MELSSLKIHICVYIYECKRHVKRACTHLCQGALHERGHSSGTTKGNSGTVGEPVASRRRNEHQLRGKQK
jgi:hypothetical protein